MSITTRKRKIGFHAALDTVRRGCGEVWSQAIRSKNVLYREYDYNISWGDLEKLTTTGSLTAGVREAIEALPFPVDLTRVDQNPFCTSEMRKAPSQQRKQTIRRLQDAFNTYFSNHESDPSHNPPRPKHFYNARWLRYHFTHDDDTLTLSMGRGRDNVAIDWPYPTPKNVDVGFESGEHVLYCVYDSEWQDLPSGMIREGDPNGEKVAGVDLGECVLAAAFDGRDKILIDGEHLRALRRIQNKEKQWFSQRIDRKQKGSNRWRKLVKAKTRRLAELRAKMEDELHKLSTRLVEELYDRGAATVVVGDITGIRDRIDYGAEMNRRLHQWAFCQFTEKIEYKAERYGMTFAQTGEAYTSQACPECSYRSRQNRSGRKFACCRCGCEAHADIVGAMNIRAKYLHPEKWEAGTVQAVRATATESDDSKGSPSSGKTQMSLFGGNSAAVWTRATHRVQYDPHMTCVVSEG